MQLQLAVRSPDIFLVGKGFHGLPKGDSGAGRGSKFGSFRQPVGQFVMSLGSALRSRSRLNIGPNFGHRPAIPFGCLIESGVSGSVIASPTVSHPNVVVQARQLVGGAGECRGGGSWGNGKTRKLVTSTDRWRCV